MGFQHMKPIMRERAGSKGGSVRTRKGLATLSPERLKEITSMGGKASADKRRQAKEQGKAAGSQMGETRLADVLGDLSEEGL